MPLLDVRPLSTLATNDALEFIYKSVHDRDEGIWAPHDSVLISRLVELFTQRGLDRLDTVRKELLAWESGVKHKPSNTPVTPPGMMERWSEAEMSLARLYLESLPPGQWTLGDNMMLVDYLVQRYLPYGELKTEAEWLATRANLMGRVQAQMEKPPSTAQAETILAALPSSVQGATAAFTWSTVERNVLEYGVTRGVENVRALADSVRHDMRQVLMQHVEEQMRGDASQSLESRLFDEFGDLNRDWRRIAVTEAGECQLQGYIAALPPGTRVRRVEQYGNACAFCRKIHGVVMEVVAADARDKDGETQIWPGKTNVGRSASPRKRVDGELVPRSADEMYWVPAGTAHPHCRGRWVPVAEAAPGDDPAFAAWLSELLDPSGDTPSG